MVFIFAVSSEFEELAADSSEVIVDSLVVSLVLSRTGVSSLVK